MLATRHIAAAYRGLYCQLGWSLARRAATSHRSLHVGSSKYTLKQTTVCPHSLRGATTCWQRRQYSKAQEAKIGSGNLKFNTTWLRENCSCEECFNHATNQRNVLYYNFTEEQTTIKSQEVTDDTCSITWSDDHKTSYPVSWLQEHDVGKQPTYAKRIMWDNKILTEEKVASVPHDEFMYTDEGLKRHLHNLVRYGVGFVSGIPADISGTEAVAERVCHVQVTIFGKMWSFTSDMARGDTAYTKLALGAHTDTSYLQLPAGIQMFHVLHHDGEGGETLLVDGFRAAEKLRRHNPGGFDLLKTTRVHHRYIEPGHYTRSLDTILVTDPVTDELINIRYNHYDRAPITTIPLNQLSRFYDALAELSSYVTEPEGEHWVKLAPGTVLFVDNFRVMHGRAGFTGNRRVCGCYLPRDDWVGKARTLRLTW